VEFFSGLVQRQKLQDECLAIAWQNVQQRRYVLQDFIHFVAYRYVIWCTNIYVSLSAQIHLNNFNGQPGMQILHKNILQSLSMLTADISSVFYNTDSCLIVVFFFSAKVI
jgi:hypothetical protein